MSKHLDYIMRTQKVTLQKAKEISIRQDIIKRIKNAQDIESLKEQIIRIIKLI